MPKTIDALRERRGLISQNKPINFVPQHEHDLQTDSEYYSHAGSCTVTAVSCKACNYKAIIRHTTDGLRNKQVLRVEVTEESELNSKKINWK